MRGSWVSTKAGNCPADLNPGFDRPEPDQPENGGANQNVQDREEVRVPSRWLDDKFQGMKGGARNRDNLYTPNVSIEQQERSS